MKRLIYLIIGFCCFISVDVEGQGSLEVKIQNDTVSINKIINNTERMPEGIRTLNKMAKDFKKLFGEDYAIYAQNESVPPEFYEQLSANLSTIHEKIDTNLINGLQNLKKDYKKPNISEEDYAGLKKRLKKYEKEYLKSGIERKFLKDIRKYAIRESKSENMDIIEIALLLTDFMHGLTLISDKINEEKGGLSDEDKNKLLKAPIDFYIGEIFKGEKYFKDVIDSININNKVFQLEKDRITEEKHQLESDKDQLEKDKDQLESDKDQLEKDKDQLTKERYQLTKERDTLTAERDTLRAKKDTLSADNTELQKDNTELQKDNTELQKDNTELQKDNTELIRQTKQWVDTAFVSLLASLFLGIFYLIYSYKKSKRMNEKLSEKEKKIEEQNRSLEKANQELSLAKSKLK